MKLSIFFFLLGVFRAFVLLADASSDTYREKNIRIYPFAFYSKETSVAGGFAGLFFVKPLDTVHLSYFQLTAVHTLKSQTNLELWYQLFLKGDKLKLTGFTDYNRYPLLFFGVGEMPGKPEHFIPSFYRFRITAYRKINSKILAGPRYWFESTKLKEVQPNGQLEMYPTMHTTSSLGVATLFDTRKNIFYPRQGCYAEISVLHSSPFLGSTSKITSLLMDYRIYHALHPRIISASQFYLNHLEGNPSWLQMNSAGGAKILRGYYQGMFRAKHVCVVQQEFRYTINDRFKAILFASLGSVRNNFRQSPQILLASYGTGFRIALDLKKQLHLRGDFAITRHGDKGIYLMLEEAF